MMLGISEKVLQDEKELRAFYESVGLNPDIIERALAAKFKPPVPAARGKRARRKPAIRAASKPSARTLASA
jgi:hypothetical protein